MDSQSPSVKGWHRFKHAFIFRRPTRAAETETEDGQAQQPFERAAIEYGCTRMVIDFDRMDQQ